MSVALVGGWQQNVRKTNWRIFTKKVPTHDAGCQRTSRELNNLCAADTAC
jgi:hypothetical protein